MSKNTLYADLVVGTHAVVSIGHGLAHAGAAVPVSLPDAIYIGLVVTAAPLVALALLHGGRGRAGALLLLASMVGALLFGLHHHFLVPSPDHVAHVVPGWQLPFGLTAALLAASEAAGAALGAWMLRAERRREVL
jgi:hypothetical protein